MRVILVLIQLLGVFMSHAQNDTLSVFDLSKFEINYEISGGNIFSYKIIQEGILLKRKNDNPKENYMEVHFVSLENLDRDKYYEIQYYLNSMSIDTFKYRKDIKYASGYADNIRIIKDNKVVFYDENKTIYFKQPIYKLLTLMNDLLPKKYKNKFKIKAILEE